MTSKIVSIPSTLKSGTVVTETSYGQSSTAGVATNVSRGDHTHGTPATDAPTTQTQPSRSFDTVYQNTSGKTMYITIQVGTAGAGSTIGCVFDSDGSNPPTTALGNIRMTPASNNDDRILGHWLVLNNNFYKLAKNEGSPTLQNWVEWT